MTSCLTCWRLLYLAQFDKLRIPTDHIGAKEHAVCIDSIVPDFAVNKVRANVVRSIPNMEYYAINTTISYGWIRFADEKSRRFA